MERMCTVPHLSDSSCVGETQQRHRSRKHMTGLCAAYRCGWIMHHDLKTPTNPVWRLMEFLISVNKALLSRGWTVRGRFVLCFCLPSYEHCGTVADVSTICCCTHSVQNLHSLFCTKIGQWLYVSVTCSFTLVLFVTWAVCVLEFRYSFQYRIRVPLALRTLVSGTRRYVV
jgi:hypothetical protein